MKQYIRELWDPENLKDMGSRQCYYFYISLHLSPILKQSFMLLSCPRTCTWSRVCSEATVTKQSQREFSVRDCRAWEKAGLLVICPVTLAWKWIETLRETGLPFWWQGLRNSLKTAWSSVCAGERTFCRGTVFPRQDVESHTFLTISFTYSLFGV